MSTAYLDSSFFLAMVLRQTGSGDLRRIIERYDRVVSADLIVAESLSAGRREAVDVDRIVEALRFIDLVHPVRSLIEELRHVLDTTYLRGADLWHVACALFVVTESRREIAFLSRDRAQRRVANRLGFVTP